MDFRSANIIFQNNQVSGIVDFESARVGSTEMDFTKINRDIFMKNSRTLETYQMGYKKNRPLIDLEVVLPFYRFTDAFNSFGWCKKREKKKYQQFFNENYVILKSILMNEG
ncbi:hypothetical protein PB01_11365 [Psychrobacillus glaciei]|uniref:Aminoglycoside phosphotransferase domain-containing protein n=2 Tax=Psychrobacillus glaciei TaxID=2283160 RepID=A0A5J6SNZ2_9BACI|nr:hypothetical protein PB01_11365 [Psychrobacillus glaciei]